MRKDDADNKAAQYLANVLKDPTGIAVVLFRTFTAMRQAGFTEPEAMDMAKHVMTMILGMGATLE